MTLLSLAPWTATISESEHSLTRYLLLFATFALAAGLIRAILTRSEVGVRYRTASVARVALMAIATATYVLLSIAFQFAYELGPTGWVPTASAQDAFAPRYVEWAVTVPLLVIELFAVTALAGTVLRRTRIIAVGGTFLMIVCGFLGAVVIDGGDNTAQLVIWGGISCIFWIIVTVLIIRAVRQSRQLLTAQSADLLSHATVLLLSGWVVYPLVFLIQILGSGGTWATVMQIALCLADVVVKLGFSGIIHRVAQLRTAEDVRAGEDMHPEAIWISSEKQSDAGAAGEVYLEADSVVHHRRLKPADSSAVASPFESNASDFD